MYNPVITDVRTIRGETNTFPTKTGLHQRFASSIHLFASIIDNLTINIRSRNVCYLPWYGFDWYDNLN